MPLGTGWGRYGNGMARVLRRKGGVLGVLVWRLIGSPTPCGVVFTKTGLLGFHENRVAFFWFTNRSLRTRTEWSVRTGIANRTVRPPGVRFRPTDDDLVRGGHGTQGHRSCR